MLHDIVCLNVQVFPPPTNLQCLGERLRVHPVWGGGGCPGIPLLMVQSTGWRRQLGLAHRDPGEPLRGLFGPCFLQPWGHPSDSSHTHQVSQLRTTSAILGPVWTSSCILVEGKATGVGDRRGLIPGTKLSSVNLGKPFNVSGLQGLPLF